MPAKKSVSKPAKAAKKAAAAPTRKPAPTKKPIPNLKPNPLKPNPVKPDKSKPKTPGVVVPTARIPSRTKPVARAAHAEKSRPPKASSTEAGNAPMAAAAAPAAARAMVAGPAPRAPSDVGVVATFVQRTPRIQPTSPAADGEEPDENRGLLSGPRDVSPYIAKRGEQYMNREQLDHFRLILNTWKRDLMVEVDRTVSHMKDEAANFPDPNDRATQEEEFSLELRTRDRERKLIRKIDEALKRIEDGSYGYCLETGEEIGIKRLEARPVATLSIEAQERRERREKQYGDRDDRYR